MALKDNNTYSSYNNKTNYMIKNNFVQKITTER